MMIFLVLFVFSVVGILQSLALIKKKYWRELVAFALLHTMAFTLSLLYVMGVPIPSPMPFLKYMVQDVLHIKYPQ
jgi:putative effector of murein hydrolase LrgA (UPF0299 family)